jgi:hypothetical protein
MIYIQAMGGLGNQLFIWNMAHHLAVKYDCAIRVVFPKSGTDRECELFSLKKECSHKIEVIENNLLNKCFSLFDRIRIRSKFIGKSLEWVFKIRQSDLPSEILVFGNAKPKFVRGYFQSSEFVSLNLHIYLDELLRITQNFAENSELFTPHLLNSQMMHIRRGDFVTNQETVGLLSIDYFKNIAHKTKDLVIFTDSESSDSVLTKNFPNSQILGADLVDTWTSFSLMSWARELFVSNSTYSWWAGVIAHFRGGKVMAPDPWTLTNVYGENYLKTEIFTLMPARFEGKDH